MVPLTVHLKACQANHQTRREQHKTHMTPHKQGADGPLAGRLQGKHHYQTVTKAHKGQKTQSGAIQVIIKKYACTCDAPTYTPLQHGYPAHPCPLRKHTPSQHQHKPAHLLLPASLLLLLGLLLRYSNFLGNSSSSTVQRTRASLNIVLLQPTVQGNCTHHLRHKMLLLPPPPLLLLRCLLLLLLLLCLLLLLL
jgi:hypothetical protein